MLNEAAQRRVSSSAGTRAAGIQSVGKAFEVLRALAATDAPMRLSQLSAATGLSASLVRAYLIVLQAEEAVRQDADSGLYDLGVAAVHLGMAALRKLDVVALARPAMDSLCERLREPNSLTLWADGAPVIVHNVERHSKFPYELKLGSSAYATTTAAGRCFLAHMSAAARKDVFERDERQLGAHAVARRALAASMKLVRETGIAERHLTLAMREDLPPRQVSIIAAPVFAHGGQVKAAITVLSQNPGFDSSPKGPPAQALLACARHVSAQLGHVFTKSKEAR